MGEVIQFKLRGKKADPQMAYRVYQRAEKLGDDPATMDEAESLYLQAIGLDPQLSIAWTNLGNIRFRRKDVNAARKFYEKALSIDNRQPEALYNIGYLLLEEGSAEASIQFFAQAIDADRKFADAYFNLAMAYEQCGMPQAAKVNWLRYAELEPEGTWSEIAKRHL